jgi:PAS domain S-box-containing protein
MLKERTSREKPQENQPQLFAAAHLAALIENNGDLVWSVDLNYRLLTFNKVFSNAFARAFGVKIAAGMTPRDLLQPKLAAIFPPLYEKALREGPCSAEYCLADGTYFEMTLSPMMQNGRKVGVSVFGKDVTRQKSAEEALRRTAEQYREFFEYAPEAIFRNTIEGKTVAVNPAGARLLGYGSPGEAIAVLKDWGRQVWFDPAERAAFVRVLEHRGEACSGPRQFRRKDGTLLWGVMTARKICGPDGKTLYYQGFLEDITERKYVEMALRESEETLREAQRIAGLGIHTQDLSTGTWSASDILREILGVGPDYNLSSSRWMDLVHPEDRAAVEARFSKEALSKRPQFEIEHRIVRNADQAVRWVRAVGKIEFDSLGGPVKLRGTIQDITESKQVEAALRESKELLQLFIAHAPAALAMFDREMRYLAASRRWIQENGVAEQEIIGRCHYDVVPDIPERWKEAHRRGLAGESLRADEDRFVRDDGTVQWIRWEVIPWRTAEGAVGGIILFAEDITEQKALELDLGTKVRELHVLSEMNSALLHAKTEEELLSEYCRIVVEVGGYRMAWVGFAEEGPEKRILPVAHYGHEDGYLKLINVTWADTERGQGPTCRCIRTGEICVSRDVATDPVTEPWREEALKRGYMSSIAIPFRQFEGEKACLTAYGVRVSRWSDAERRLMNQVASALGYGITTLRTAVAKAQHQESLRVSLEQTIEVIAETVDQRDPYTAGHQRRVADLCVAIAGKLGLSSERTQGLRLAAGIHDLGKIGIPAEILVKPGRLTENQYSLLKEHPQLGYEIVKNVQFPWPIAQMILQHHERLDGSGYPQGLKADEIFLESRILAVADVVEAMSSHRPYRPSMGIDVALDEVLSKSGALYDPEAVQACVNLFRHEGYQFPRQ